MPGVIKSEGLKSEDELGRFSKKDRTLRRKGRPRRPDEIWKVDRA
jgi:hypothetical protein